jgi:hypothetical protein
MIQDYASLQTAISDWLLRSDLEQQIPTFISLAEASFNRRLRLRAMLKQVITVSRNGRATLPSDFLEVKKVQLDLPVRMLRYVTPDELVTRQTNPVSVYSILGDSLILTPDTWTATKPPEEILQVEDSNYLLRDVPNSLNNIVAAAEAGVVPIGLTYYGKIKALSNTQTTNDLLDLAPDLYLFGSLMATSHYLKEDNRLSLWKSLYDEAVAEQRIAEDRAEHGSAPLIMKQRRAY